MQDDTFKGADLVENEHTDGLHDAAKLADLAVAEFTPEQNKNCVRKIDMW